MTWALCGDICAMSFHRLSLLVLCSDEANGVENLVAYVDIRNVWIDKWNIEEGKRQNLGNMCTLVYIN
jgi:hypothetical protein